MRSNYKRNGIFIFVMVFAAMILFPNQVKALVTEQVLDFEKVVPLIAMGATMAGKQITDVNMGANMNMMAMNIKNTKVIYDAISDAAKNAISVRGEGITEDVANIETLLKLFDESVNDGTLEGKGEGKGKGKRKSADNRLRTLRKMIVKAGDMIENEDIIEACNKLTNIYGKKLDSFATGDAIPKLKNMIQRIMEDLKCK